MPKKEQSHNGFIPTGVPDTDANAPERYAGSDKKPAGAWDIEPDDIIRIIGSGTQEPKAIEPTVIDSDSVVAQGSTAGERAPVTELQKAHGKDGGRLEGEKEIDAQSDGDADDDDVVPYPLVHRIIVVVCLLGLAAGIVYFMNFFGVIHIF